MFAIIFNCVQGVGRILLVASDSLLKIIALTIMANIEFRHYYRKLEWIEYGEASLLVASKGHVLTAWLLNDNLEILNESILQVIAEIVMNC